MSIGNNYIIYKSLISIYSKNKVILELYISEYTYKPFNIHRVDLYHRSKIHRQHQIKRLSQAKTQSIGGVLQLIQNSTNSKVPHHPALLSLQGFFLLKRPAPMDKSYVAYYLRSIDKTGFFKTITLRNYTN